VLIETKLKAIHQLVGKFRSLPSLSSFAGVLGANVFNNLITFIGTIFVARSVGVTEFAKFSLAVAITVTVSSVTDFGASLALVRLYNSTSDRARQSSLIKVVREWKTKLFLFLVLLTYPIGQILAIAFPVFKDSMPLLYCSLISGGLLTLWTTTRAIEQARKEFRSFQLYVVAYGALRLFFLALMYFNHQISVLSVFSALYFLPLAALLTSKWVPERVRNPHRFQAAKGLFAKNANQKVLKSVLGYGTWIGIAGILYSWLFQIPQFMLGYADPNQAGLYGAGLTFVNVFLLVNDAVRTIILPDVSAIRDAEGRQAFRRKLWQLAPTFLGSMTAILLGVAGVQYLLLGDVYRASVPGFLAIGGGIILTMYLGYFNTLIHSMGIPHIAVFVNSTSAVTLIALCLLIPKSALSVSIVLGIVLLLGEATTYFIVERAELKRRLQ
jgi:O-antigen/teichoic acid export membrane protein